MKTPISGLLALSLSLGATAVPTTNPTCLPIVDLGYERHQALSYNETTQVYKFQNIRYAQNPTENLRFRAPLPPERNKGRVQTGAGLRMCPQGIPVWQSKAFVPTAEFSNPNKPFDLKEWEEAILNGTVFPGDPNEGASEDCLFLDVHVPKKVLGRKGKGHGAPVLVWIHGGGYVLGSKQGTPQPGYDPSGLLMHAARDRDDMIFVALNYRLGALGFLAGPEVKNDGNLNAGILDQRMALEWVQQNIHLFGGAKDRVTVMGESGGGGSIILHMAARGGKGPSPFAQAIPQSPAYMPSGKEVESSFGEFLTYLNVSSLKEARKLDEKAVIAANAAQLGDAPSINYIYGPVIDGDYVPQAPISMVKQGRLDPSVKVLTGYNIFEGGFFFDPTVKTEEQFKVWLARSLPGISEESQEYLTETLYPAQFDSSLGYVDYDTRQMRLWSEAVIDCNYDLLSKVIKDKGYAYEFGVSPGFHIQDLDYTFNNPFDPAGYPEAQDSLQTAIVSFVQKGVPVMKNGQRFPHPGMRRGLVNITSTAEEVVSSRVNETRCAWWGDLDTNN